MNTAINSHGDRHSIYNIFMQEINSIAELIDRYPFEDKKAYGYFLNQQYFLIRYSTRLLALSASQIDTNDPDEFRWWTQHLQEEIDHDQAILNDMAAISYPYTDECEAVIRGLSLALFEDVRRHGPDALLGYALLLEGLSLVRCKIIADRIKNTYGTGFSYLKLHAMADEKHFPQGISRLENFPRHRRQIALDNLHMSACLYRVFISMISHLHR